MPKAISDLKKDQWLFAECISKLLAFTYLTYHGQDVKLRLDDFNRPDKKGHMTNSRHYERCAGDILLDVNGEYVTDSHHPIYIVMGTYWETLHPRARWGGKFRSVDGNHFSIASPDLKRA